MSCKHRHLAAGKRDSVLVQRILYRLISVKSQDRQLTEKIMHINKANRGMDGSPRVHKALRKQGVYVGRKRVERLMRGANLVARLTKVVRRKSGINAFHQGGKNQLLEAGPTTRINQVWVGDITYLKVKDQWFHLAVIMDRHSRRVINWTLRKPRTAEVTVGILKKAIRIRKPTSALLFHSDRGIEYTAHKYRNELKRNNIEISVNRPGHCTDNAHMESFFHSLKAELIRGRKFNTVHELRYALNSYINGFYNQRRLYSGVD